MVSRAKIIPKLVLKWTSENGKEIEVRDTIINFIHPATKPLSGSQLEKHGNLEGIFLVL